MAVVSKNPISSIFSARNLLLSISVLFMAFILRLYVPLLFEVVVSGAPVIRSWFTPPYLYVVVNFIIIAIAASSRFQQKMEEGVSELMASARVHQADTHKDTYDVVGRKTSGEHKTEFRRVEPEMYPAVNQKQSVDAKIQDYNFESRIGSRENGYAEAKDSEVQIKKKPVYVEPKRELEVKIKRKPLEPKKEFEFYKPKKYEFLQPRNLQVNNNMERSAKEGEDEYARGLKSVEVPNRTSTVEIPMDYSPEEIQNSGRSDDQDQEYDEEILPAGKEVSAAAGEEENDTLEGTWKMIMQSRRIHEAALQQASDTSTNARSPSHSRKKQDTYNY